ncbi:MAG: sulfatase-like hydrolase/transferase [Deltaproteobacteria bacterium]|nr:sulfatase-like hydrolase/transferase [Deltaproteobacteria bacterium]
MRAPHRTRRLGLTLLAAAQLVGCGEPSRPNLLLVTFDTTRADAVNLSDPAGPTPTLAALAARGLWFERATSPVPLTLPAHASLLSGLEPLAHGARSNGVYVVDPAVETLAERLAQAGYHTAAAIGALPLAGRFGLNQGFARYDEGGFTQRSQAATTFPERDAEAVIRAALAEPLPEPWFLWVHFYDPHQPWITPTKPGESAYTAEIRATDAALGRLLGALGGEDELLVVVTADHGESLGEHGEATHGWFVHDATTRVPLVMAGPGVPDHGAVGGDARLIDVAPTILDLLGLGAIGQGESLRPLWEEGPDPPRPVYGESVTAQESLGLAPISALRVGDLRVVRSGRDRLYDLSADPQELHDVSAERPEELARTQAALTAYVEAHTGPLAAAGPRALDAETQALLSQLGYVDAGVEETGGDLYDSLDLLAVHDQLSLSPSQRRLDPALLVRVLRAHPRALSLWARGVPFLLELEHPEAAALAIEAAGLFPADEEVQARAATVMARAGDPRAAEGLTAFMASGRGAATDTRSEVLALWAQVALSLGRVEDARALVNTLAARPLLLGPELYDRALLRHSLGDVPGAAADYAQAAQVLSDDAALWANFAGALAQLGRLPEAMTAVERSLALDPTQTTLWARKAALAQAMGDETKAAESCAEHQRLGGRVAPCVQ